MGQTFFIISRIGSPVPSGSLSSDERCEAAGWKEISLVTNYAPIVSLDDRIREIVEVCKPMVYLMTFITVVGNNAITTKPFSQYQKAMSVPGKQAGNSVHHHQLAYERIDNTPGIERVSKNEDDRNFNKYTPRLYRSKSRYHLPLA